MRVKLGPTGGAGAGGVFAPGDPRPPQGTINDIFQLEVFRSPDSTYRPFQPLVVEWRVAPVDGGSAVPDYRFLLVAGQRTVDNDIALSGTRQITLFGETSLTIRGAPRGTSNWQSVGNSLHLSVDTSACQVFEIDRSIIDGLVTEQVTALTGDTASFVLRGDPAIAWTSSSITYGLPFRIDIPSFFNANLDVGLEVFFRVFHDGADSELDLTIQHSSDVVFSNLEHILSGGHAATVEKTAQSLIPLLLDCVCRSAEAQAIQSLLFLLSNLPPSLRLLSIKIVPLDDQSRLEITVCPS